MTWADERPLLECDNGRTLFLDQVGLLACGSQTTTCSATAGEWRACMRALFEEPCLAAEHEPATCVALRSATGCSELALPLLSSCTPPAADYVTSFDGVYELVSHTGNDAGCDAADGAPRSSPGYIALAATHFPGNPLGPLRDTPMLMLQYCVSIAACHQRMAELLRVEEPYYALGYYGPAPVDLPDSFVCGPDESGALIYSSVGVSFGEGCSITSQQTALRLDPDGFVRIEDQRFELPGPAPGEPCALPLEPDANRRCISSDVLRARRVSTL